MISTTNTALMQQQQPIQMNHRPMRFPKRRSVVSLQQPWLMWIAFLGMVAVLSPWTQLIPISSAASPRSSSIWGVAAASTTTAPDHRRSSFRWSQLGSFFHNKTTTETTNQTSSNTSTRRNKSDRHNQKRANKAPGSTTGTSTTTNPLNETVEVDNTKRRRWGTRNKSSAPADNLNDKNDPMNETADDTTKKIKTTKQTGAGRRGWFGSSSKTTTNQTSTTSSSTNETVTSITGTNETTAQPPPSSEQQQQRPTPDQSPTGLIIIGAPPSHALGQQQSIVIPRGTSSIGGTPTMIRPQSPSPSGGENSVMMLGLMSNLISQAIKVWFVTWLTRRMASEEESIQPSQHYCWECINDKFVRDTSALQTALQAPPPNVPLKTWQRHLRSRRKGMNHANKKNNNSKGALSNVYKRTVVLIELHPGKGGSGSDAASSSSSRNTGNIDLEQLPDVVTFLLQQQRQHAFGSCATVAPNGKWSEQQLQPMELEIVFSLTSPGGTVARYGLAASQLQRLKARRVNRNSSNHSNGTSEGLDDDTVSHGNGNNMENPDNITTTVCVDSIAASGGYMIASQADRLIAAPFATLGSVGVIMEFLNFYELAKQYGVQQLVVKSGESKNPLSQWGPVNKQDLDREQQRLAKVHAAFKELVLRGRPGLLNNMEQVTDGSIYLGQEALELGLIDAVMTTDEYILERIEAGDRVLKLHPTQQGRYGRQLRLSPQDILPHLRSWISHKLRATNMEGNDETLSLVSRAVQTGTWIGFINHVVRTYLQR